MPRLQHVLARVVTSTAVAFPTRPGFRVCLGIARRHLAMASKPQAVFILGLPGSGKGTQCAMLVEKYGFCHLSAGDCLRTERKSGSDLGNTIEGFISQGNIVPSKITVQLLKNAMDKNQDTQTFLIDGFPRNFENVQVWKEVIGDTVDTKFMLFLDAPDDVCVARCVSRGAAGSGRSDDKAEVIKTRLKNYREQTAPVIDDFAAKGLQRTVNGNRPADEVSKDVCALFDAPASSAGVGQTGVSVLGLAIAAGLAFMAFSRK